MKLKSNLISLTLLRQPETSMFEFEWTLRFLETKKLFCENLSQEEDGDTID